MDSVLAARANRARCTSGRSQFIPYGEREREAENLRVDV